MAVLEQVQSDATAALKAGDRERAGALRLIVSELQKAEKEGAGDEVEVLQRERKRRLESATAYRDAGRDDLAGAEEREAELIERVPARADLRRGAAGASSATPWPSPAPARPKEMGKVMALVMPKVKGRADGKRVSAAVKEKLTRVVARKQIELSNEVATELAGPGDVIMRTLEEHLDCDVFLRGNVLTLDGARRGRGDGRDRGARAHRPGPPGPRGRARARSRRSAARSSATRARAGSSRTWSGATAG